MEKLKAALAVVAERLGLNRPLLARAQRRYKANRKRAFVAHNEAVRFDAAVDRLRAAGHPHAAATKEKEAARAHTRAYRNHLRAQFWLGRIKVLQQRIHNLETREEKLREQIRKLDQVVITGNRATGGTPQQRLKAVALQSAANCAGGRRLNFYSQPGRYTVDKCLTGESYGERSDCSQWFTSVYKACGLDDPNGQGWGWGYTGTLVEHGVQIQHAEPGCAVIYGSGAGHHVELYVGPGNKTIGHGSAPIDPGVIDLFGDGRYRFFKFV